MPQLYNNPPSVASSIGAQVNTQYWDRRSLMDAAQEMYFSPLADVKTMPTNHGKTLKVFYYVPLLDDRNVNDQGLNAAGVSYVGGNLYGSSKDVGTITDKIPTLTETGGRVNRVGFTRITREGTIYPCGFCHEFTEDSLTFDTDAELYSHLSREMVRGANEITEDLLQIDLLNAAGVTVYTGTAQDDDEMTGEGADPSVVTYQDLKKLGITLDDNRTPKSTKIIKGSSMIDTMTVNASRILYIGSELQITIENMVDGLGNAAFTPVRKYAGATTILNGEIGSIADFRVVVNPNMMKWAGVGADVDTNPGYSATEDKYDIFPMLVVGSESFATIGLQSGGKAGAGQKFKIITKKPGEAIATTSDPYGKVGFSSISFYYGFIALRPERIAVIKTCAPE